MSQGSILPFVRPPEPGADLTFAQLVEQYLDYARRTRLYTDEALASRERYLPEVTAGMPVLVRDCRRSDFEIWLADNSERLGDWTRHSVVSIVHACLNWAVKDKRIPFNPFAGFNVPEGEPRRPMTDEEFVSLLRAADTGFRRILLFLRHTASRPGELRKLRWQHIDLDRCRCELPPADNRKGNIGNKRAKKPRIIRLPQPLVKMLRVMGRDGMPPDGFVFKSRRGRQWGKNSLAQKLLRLRRRLGIPDDCKLYGARHAFGTGAVKNGVDLKTLAELMGHSSSKTTERYYVHLDREEAHLQAKLAQATKRR